MAPPRFRSLEQASPLHGLHVLGLMRFVPQFGRVALPDICCDIVMSGERAWVLGPMTKGQPTRHAGESITLLQVHPSAARAWLGVPLCELTDRRLPLDDLRPNATEALLSARGNGLLDRLRGPSACDSRIATAARALSRGERVATAAAAVSLTVRQLERRFLDAFGMSPKRFAQVVQFRRAVMAIADGCSFAEAAYAHGYADQAHLSRTARSLMGRTLRQLSPNVAIVQEPLRTET